MKQGFTPDSISTDLHIESMNAGMKDMLNLLSKFLNIGMSVDDVIRRATWNPAREIHHEDLGHLTPGAVADVAVLSRTIARDMSREGYDRAFTAALIASGSRFARRAPRGGSCVSSTASARQTPSMRSQL